MAAKGKASVSSTGASMSKYDVEVEGRLKALEAAVAKLQADSHPKGSKSSGSVDDSALLKSEQFKGLAEDVARMRKTLGI